MNRDSFFHLNIVQIVLLIMGLVFVVCSWSWMAYSMLGLIQKMKVEQKYQAPSADESLSRELNEILGG